MIVTDRAGVLRAFDWTTHEDRMMRIMQRHYGPSVRMERGAAPGAVRAAFASYFDGNLRALDRLDWATGGTAFQRGVWKALTAIPAGETLSYAGLAARIGKPTAMRAVGMANGQNPVAIVVPCHRVIGANGSLTGYGGGLHRKRWLLIHEGAAFREAPEQGDLALTAAA